MALRPIVTVTFSTVAIRKMWLILATTSQPPAHRPQSSVVFEFWTTSQARPLKATIWRMTQQE